MGAPVRSSVRGACRPLVVLLALLVTTAAARAAPGDVERVIVFGDSLSDTGNVFDVFGIPAAPNFQGRFSNGLVWVEGLATGLGAPAPTPSRNGGTNYAYGGAETGFGTFFLFLLEIGTQVEQYVTSGPAPAAGDLFVLLGGANDFDNGQSDPSIPAQNMLDRVETLAAAGGTRFVVANLPPIGQTPRYRGTASEAVLDARCAAFNAELAAGLDQLESTLGITIHRVDLFEMFEEVLADPAAFGFTNVTEPAFDGSVVPNPDEYLFWDDLHPTRVAHAELAARALAVVAPPVPGDADGDGDADFADLLAVLGAWGPCPAPCGPDLDGNGTVGFADLLLVLTNWS